MIKNVGLERPTYEGPGNVKLQRIHLRINDAATGQPTPVRLRVTDAEGAYFAPYGRLAHFATDRAVDVGLNLLDQGRTWTIIDGACEIDVPVGPLRIQASKGFEYEPLDETVNLAAGKMSVRFAMKRRCDIRSSGWHSGDTCAYEMSPHAALLEAEAEDLAVVDLLIRETEHHGTRMLTNMAAFSGQVPALARPGCMVVVNTRNQGSTGALLLLNSHRVVYPLSFKAGEPWTYADWRDQCKRKIGLVVADDWMRGAEFGLDGGLDAIRFLPGEPLDRWMAILDLGKTMPLVAGSGKESNRQRLGSWRTYAQLDGPLDYRNWTEAIREGRTFVTRGPILLLDVDGYGPGAHFADSPDGASANVAIDSPGFTGRLEIVVRGEVVAGGPGPRVDAKVPLIRGWIVARAVDLEGVAALTSPVYIGLR